MRAPSELLYNFHWIVPGEAARSAQAFVLLLRPLLEKNAIKSIVNLRGGHPDLGWWRRETRLCQDMHVAHFDVPLDSRHLPTRPMLVSLLDAFDIAERPLLMKCSGGQDRTSLAASLYILHRRGWEARGLALEQFRAMPYLHFPRRHQKWLKPFATYAEQQSRGAPLADWVRSEYDPNAFALWLTENGLSGSFKEVYVRPRDRLKRA
jgi:protein tyrosine/serine phosphatase